MMKLVLLIKPKRVANFGDNCVPVGLCYLAAYIKKYYRVKIIDLNVMVEDNSSIIPKIEWLNPDFIGITALSYAFDELVELSENIKKSKKLTNVPLILGGVHTTCLPELTFRKTKADYLILGEGEKPFFNLLNALSSHSNPKDIKSVCYIENENLIHNPREDFITNLDDIPFPAYELIPLNRYPFAPYGFLYKKKPIFPIFASRGCPFDCRFCASPTFWGHKIRFRSVQNVIEEIEYLIKHFDAKEFQFWDDNFTLNRKFVIEFCREILKRKIQVYFTTPNGVRIESLDTTMLKWMKAAGFYSLTFAIESGSNRIQSLIKKNINLTKIASIITIAKKMGFFNRAYFIFGLPYETISEVYQTLDLSLKLNIHQAAFFMFTPLPGSFFFKEWLKSKNLDEIHWNFNFFSNRQYIPHLSKISNEDLKKLRRYISIRFHFFKPLRVIKQFSVLKFPILKEFIIDRINFILSVVLKINFRKS